MIVSNLANSLLLIIDDILDISKSSYRFLRQLRYADGNDLRQSKLVE